MATKMCFLVDEKEIYKEEIIEFTYIKGMAFSQKQKNVLSFHDSINKKYPNKKILEISTKSNNPLGVKLSAFNIIIDGKYFESIFQSSKVFNNDIQYLNVIKMNPKQAKQFIRDNSSGNIIKFRYNNVDYPIEPKSAFYDYMYILAISKLEISKMIKDYEIFTDIEFNEKKQINCQARACAIYSYMLRVNKLDYYLESFDRFIKIYTNNKEIKLFY